MAGTIYGFPVISNPLFLPSEPAVEFGSFSGYVIDQQHWRLPERIEHMSGCACCGTLYCTTASGKIYQICQTPKGKPYTKRRAWNAHLLALFM